MNSWYTTEGAPFPLGVTYIKKEDAYNFALYSKNAGSVTLLLYTADSLSVPAITKTLDPKVNKSQRIWHCRLKRQELMGAVYYAYQVSGNADITGEPAYWQQFDPAKILLDPYAREVFFPDDFSIAAACQPGSNAGKAPLGFIHADSITFNWKGDQTVRHEGDLVIYEMHVRGFTMGANSGVEAAQKGTFAGIIEKIPYLIELGVTAVELMPVHQFQPGDGDYWGYSTLSFFSPHQAYSSDKSPGGAINEFKTMVKALHKAGIEVILDVVFNHTTEGDIHGPVYSFKGIDNSTYYLLNNNSNDPYENYSGAGNTVRTDHPAVQRLIVDSMRYWVKEMHVDGFRFDLAAIFSVQSENTTAPPPIFAQLSADPDFQQTRLIAEPWYSGNDLQGGQFPGNTWAQWNGQYRDDIRRAIKSDSGMVGPAITRLYGSNDLFPDDLLNANHPYQSINFINCHDGFTLYDLVAYDNPGGHDSWNCGWEGDINVPQAVMDLRLRQAKNFSTILMLSNGTPMFVAGDEYLHTQSGNDNPYNQDDASIWLDWNRQVLMKAHYDFTVLLIRFRKAFSLINRSRFWQNDFQTIGFDGNSIDYSDPALRYFAYHLTDSTGGPQELYVMANFNWISQNFTIKANGNWKQVINTYLGPGLDILVDQPIPVNSGTYLVGERSVAVLCR